MARKVIFSLRKETTVTEEDLGTVTTSSESDYGEWPDCLGDKIPSLTTPSGEKDCSCVKHTMFWLMTPKEVWPDYNLQLVRVMEKE